MWLMFLMKCWKTDTSRTQARSGIQFNSLGYQGLRSISLALSFVQTFNQNGGEGCVCTGRLPTRTGWAGHGRPIGSSSAITLSPQLPKELFSVRLSSLLPASGAQHSD